MSMFRPLAALLLAAASAPAAATFHLVSIREVYVGSANDPNSQYVELQMYAADQTEFDSRSLTFFGPTGNVLGAVTFAADLANGANQASILVATNTAAARFNVVPDLAMPAALNPAGGKVCFEDVDCFSWGNYSGPTATPSPSGNPFNPVGGLQPDTAVTRDISGGNSATRLDANDDTDNSAADFVLAATPAPTNNAAGGDPGGDPGQCGYNGCRGGDGSGGGYGSGSLAPIASLLLLLAAAGRRHRIR